MSHQILIYPIVCKTANTFKTLALGSMGIHFSKCKYKCTQVRKERI